MAVPHCRVQDSASSFEDPSITTYFMKVYCITWSRIEVWRPR